ncbi:hypothetical protein Tco_0682090 [Tanacetum coccineum]|uniref:Retrovirus-related Pol polyprotein from transposon TNT 1-94 n=1 Tax=Tanacetum coccineum TaxID=301880 RepID=A0ABQ4XQU7_9ASTR
MKAKLSLLEDEKEVSDDEEVTQVKVLMALADDELTVRKNHARNGEWIDITTRKSLKPTKTSITPESSKDSEAESLIPMPALKIYRSFTKLRGNAIDLPTPLYKERSGLGIMKHTKPETHYSLNKSVSGSATVSETEQTIPPVPTKVKDTKQE